MDARTEIVEVFHEFYDAWAKRHHKEDLQYLMIYCTENVTVIGTAAHEILIGVDAYRDMIASDLEEVPGQVSISFPWTRARLFGDVGYVEAEMELKLPVDGSLQDIGSVRVTQLYQRVDGRWLIEHVHMSFPSADQTSSEVWPIDALKARNLELERQVAERTTALRQKTEALEAALDELQRTQAQLVQSEKMASLGRVTAGIAHEIKNPLNFINNFADLNESLVDELRELIENGESVADLLDDVQQNASVIARHGARADAIVHSMMQHVSIGGGERRHVKFNALVAESIDLAYNHRLATQPDFKVCLETQLGENIGSISLVPESMGRVVISLLENAFDAITEVAGTSEAERATIIVSTNRDSERVKLRVSDNGAGIPEENQDKIFEPFFTTKPTGTGIGLGLSLAYDIVTQGHGGTLSVDSRPGEGATFICSLPVAGLDD